jgi:hypothetical protein
MVLEKCQSDFSVYYTVMQECPVDACVNSTAWSFYPAVKCWGLTEHRIRN